MGNRERIKNEIKDIKYELDKINSIGGLKIFGEVIHKCFNSENPEETLKELKEEFGENDSMISLAKAILSGPGDGE